MEYQAKTNIVELLKVLKNHHYETFQHSFNVSHLSLLIAEELGIPADEIIVSTIGGLLHDIGKIKIRPLLLSKPSRLTEIEWTNIKKHPQFGARILSTYPWGNKISSIILYHHERIDGYGYFGLKGTSIPLSSRIICIADAFEAMISPRPYQEALSLSESWKEIQRNSESQFDPNLVQILINITSKKFEGVRKIIHHSNEAVRQAEISLKFSEFEIPPMQDVLLIGRKAPIGPEAARRMVNALSPDQYDIIPVPEGPLEAVIIRKALLNMVPEEILLPIILYEGVKVASETTVTKAQLDLTIVVKRTVEL